MRRRFGLAAGLVGVCTVTAADEDLAARVAAAPTLPVEAVCEPMRTTHFYSPHLVPNPDGTSCDVLIRYYHSYWGPHTTYAIDLATGKLYTHTEPSGLPAQHNFIIGPDRRFYQHWIIPGSGTVLMAYDPGTNAWTRAAVDLPLDGETRPLCTGTDGKIYGAASRGTQVCAYQYDPATGRVTDYGALGPEHAPNPSWGYSVAADAEYVYIASGKIPWYIVACHKATGQATVIHTMDDPLGHVGVSQERYGCTASSRGHGKVENFWLYQGKALPKQGNPPWPQPTPVEPWVRMPPLPELGTGDLQPQADGRCQLWYRLPGETDWRSVAFTVPTLAVGIFRLTALADGRLCGSGGNYLGAFVFDPATGVASHPGIVHLSHYCSTVSGAKVYMSGYPSSALYEWDPAAPWTANRSDSPQGKPLGEVAATSNPRRLTYLNQWSGTHKMWTATTAADGRTFFGGRWYRNGEGGGLAWWDPKTGTGGGVAEPFTTYQIAFLTTAGDGRYVVVSSICARDQSGKLPTPEHARVFVFDTQTNTLVRDFVPVPQADISGAVAGVGGPFILGLTYDPADRAEPLKPEDEDPYLKEKTLAYGVRDRHSILYKANVETGEVLWTKRLPYPVGFRTNENFDHQDGFDFRRGPDGRVWTFTGARYRPVNPKAQWHYAYTNCTIVEDAQAADGFRLEGMNCALVRIDPADGAVHVVGKLTHPGEMAFIGRDLYFAGGDKYLGQHNTHLRRLRQAVPE